MLHLGPHVQALWCTPESVANMGHHQTHTEEILQQLDDNDGIIHLYNDIYHGSESLNACIHGNITPKDTIVMISIDGAQIYQDKHSDCWIYIWIVLDLASDLCYNKKHIPPVGFIPSLNNPTNME